MLSQIAQANYINQLKENTSYSDRKVKSDNEEIKYENLIKISQLQMHIETNKRKKDKNGLKMRYEMSCFLSATLGLV